VDQKPTPDDARLLRRLAAGHEEAFAELYARFGTRLYRTALGLLARSSDAEDCVQETFAALVRSRVRLAEVRDLPSYLFAVLRRQAARHASRGHRRPAALPADLPDHRPADDPRREALRGAIAALPPEQREVIALKIDAELTFAEIGRVLEISPNTAASRYRYALERLREQLRND
jgi:RNA polymerase sigma-70 factor (ECF subfamily)